MKLRVTVGVAAFAFASVVASSVEAADPRATTSAETAVLDRSERLAKEVEAWELKGASAFGEDQERASGLQKVSSDLSEYLKAHPNDVRALLLRARVLRALVVVTPVAVKLEDQGGHITAGDTSDQRSAALAAIDAVLALQPKNAEAFYWKARTLNLSNPAAEQVGAEPVSDPMPAVAAARLAATLEPSNATYREYLAMVLFGLGQQTEALDELRKLPFKHPVLQLLDDRKLVPLPANAKSDEGRAYDMARTLFSGQMDLFRYAGIRPQVFDVALLPSDIQAFYRRLWPTIHWVKDRENGSFSAALLWRQDKLLPTANPAPFMSDLSKQVPPSGLLLVVVRDEDAKPARSSLYVVNFRR
jgi:hypothetical protein